jgi:hypothetical protein
MWAMKCKSCGAEARQLWLPDECGACFGARFEAGTAGPTIEALIEEGLLAPFELKTAGGDSAASHEAQGALYQQSWGRAFRPIPPSRAQAAKTIIGDLLELAEDNQGEFHPRRKEILSSAHAWLAEHGE